MNKQLFAIASLAGVLVACTPALQPVPVGVNVSAPIAWRTQITDAGPVEARWWQSFGDPMLSQLVEAARTNNPDVNVATARVAEARATEQVSRALLLPSIGAGVDAAVRREVNPLGRSQESLVAMPAFQASYEVDLFGKNRARIDAAEANFAAAKAAEDAARLSVTAATASGYVTLIALDARLDVLKQTLRSREEAVKFARDRAEVGYTSQLELRQAQAEYAATAQQVPQAEAQIARQENAISVLTGILPAAITRGGGLNGLIQPASPDILPSDLLRRRPDVAAAEYRIAAADAQMRSARAQFMPSINLGASAGLALSDLLSNPISIWSIGGSILAPIFQGGRLEGQLNAVTAQRDQAAWAYRATALNAFREVEDRMVTLKKLDEQQLSLRAQQAAANDVLRHTRNRYRAGYISYIEQLDAQRASLNVELALVQLRADRFTTLIGLYQAFGGPLADNAAEIARRNMMLNEISNVTSVW